MIFVITNNPNKVQKQLHLYKAHVAISPTARVLEFLVLAESYEATKEFLRIIKGEVVYMVEFFITDQTHTFANKDAELFKISREKIVRLFPEGIVARFHPRLEVWVTLK